MSFVHVFRASPCLPRPARRRYQTNVSRMRILFAGKEEPISRLCNIQASVSFSVVCLGTPILALKLVVPMEQHPSVWEDEER